MSLAVQGSVKARLLASLLSGVLLVWLAAAALTAWETHAEMQELLDAHLAQSASLLAAQVGHEIDEGELLHLPALHKYAHNVAFQVWAQGETLLLHSPGAPSTKLATSETGFSNAFVNGRAWRVFSHWDAQRQYLIQVGEAVEVREHLSRELLEKLLQPLLIALPLLGLLIWVGVGEALKPVARISAALARRDPRHLAPIEGEVPKEIAPMVERLNALLARVAATLENERRFTSDAAHELRTPLAALKTQLQVAQGATEAAERAHAIAQAIEAGDRATRLVEQLLTLARLEHDAWREQAVAVDLRELASRALAEAAQQAYERHITLSLEAATGLMVQGHPGLLAILLRNLIDNALRYSQPHTAVAVNCYREGEETVLQVTDQGPGIPAPERDHVLRPFHRLEGTQAPGSGLGLSIVARIAQLHGARLELADRQEGSGLAVRVCFRRAGD